MVCFRDIETNNRYSYTGYSFNITLMYSEVDMVGNINLTMWFESELYL